MARSPILQLLDGWAPAWLLLAAWSGASAGETERLEPAAESTAYERSLALVRSVLERRPQDPRVLNVLADVHFRQGRFSEAIAAFQEVLRLDPAASEALLGMAEAWHRLNDSTAALEGYSRVIAGGAPGPSAQARRGMAEVHYKTGNYREAIATLQETIGRGDASAEILFLLARSLDAHARELKAAGERAVEAEKVETEALAWLGRALEADPAHAPSHYLRAGIHRRRGRQALARQDLASFERLRPALQKVEQADLASAEARFESSTALALARVIFAATERRQALDLADKALAVDPSSLEALAFKGWIHLRLDRHAEAAAIYESILAREPNHAEALWNLGKIHAATGRIESGAPLLLRAAEIRKSFADGWELLRDLAQERGIYAERREEFARMALRQRPSAANHAALAIVLFEKGAAGECRKVLLEGLRRHPEDPELLEALSALESASGASR
jgi:tetratricopeptide (TPR) repeat protein